MIGVKCKHQIILLLFEKNRKYTVSSAAVSVRTFVDTRLLKLPPFFVKNLFVLT